MIRSPSRSFTTSDLRRPEVVEEAFDHPVVVRDGRSGRMLYLISQSVVDAHNEMSRLTDLFVRAVVECQRPDPSPAQLGEIGFIVSWLAAERDRFLRGFAEALAAGLAADDPAPATGFISIMSHSDDPVPDHLAGRFSASERDRLAARFAV